MLLLRRAGTKVACYELFMSPQVTGILLVMFFLLTKPADGAKRLYNKNVGVPN